MAVKQATVAQESLQWGLLPPEWPDLLKEDWQNKTNGINEVAEVANEANVTANSESEKNEAQDKAIENNRQTINTLAENILINDQKTANNTIGIKENKQAIADNKKVIDDHVSDNSAHGATGDIVGNQDYAQELIGGVVLLASNITELTNYSAQAAPEAYNQEEEQAFRDGVQSEINKLVEKVNEIVQGQITAKQMGPNVPTT